MTGTVGMFAYLQADILTQDLMRTKLKYYQHGRDFW
jgi:hypothetical protein